jgi:cytochrome c oxidase cbb3-type subunit 3
MSEPKLTDHAYDGIQEYDNPLPFWWTGVFIATVGWAIGYFAWFHGGGPGKSPQQEYAIAQADWQAKRDAADKAAAASVNEEMLAGLAADPAAVERGKGIFTTRCVACHADDGRGLVGPNLTDEMQIHGASRMDIYRTVYDGVLDKGMVAWGPQLTLDELTSVVAFVTTLRGTNRPGGKPPEGQPVGPFPR